LTTLQDFSLTFWLYINPTNDVSSSPLPLLGKVTDHGNSGSATAFLQINQNTDASETTETPTASPTSTTSTAPSDQDNKNTDKNNNILSDEVDLIDFGLYFIPQTQSLLLKSETAQPKIELNSRGRIRYGRWTHVTLVGTLPHSNSAGYYQLYLNGVLDAISKPISGGGSWGSPRVPFYVGTIPSATSPSSSSGFLLDDLKIWSRPVTWLEVAADSFPSLGGLETYYTKMGCDVGGCTCDQAITACQHSNHHGSVKFRYHLCNENELYSGAYQVARTMGWTEWDTKLWILDEKQGGCLGADEQELRLALCCLV